MYCCMLPNSWNEGSPSLPRPNLCTKKYCSLINFGLHHYQPTQWLLTDSTHLSQHLCTYAHCLFRLLFLSIISTAYHLLSVSRAARLLLNWLIDWMNEWMNGVSAANHVQACVRWLKLGKTIKYIHTIAHSRLLWKSVAVFI